MVYIQALTPHSTASPPGSESLDEVEAKMVVEGVSDLSDESDAHSIGTLR